MNEQLKKVFDPIRAFWGKLTKKTKIVICICLGAAVLLAVVSSALMNRTQYTVLYSGLGSDEAQAITNELRTLDVDYRYDNNGTVYIDKNKENAIRMQLANEGYPKTAPNYDFFTSHVGVMTTDEERKTIEQYQLQERLSAVIKTIDAVDTAAVTISLPESNNYAWDDSGSAASASVAVGLKNGKSLDAKQVNGIKQLVSKSVPNLKADNVTVMDTSTGEELSASSGDDSGSTQVTLSEFKLKIEKQYEDNLQNKILNLLSKTYGRDNLSVSVKSKMDLDKKIQDIVTYSPSTSGGKGIVSHSEETYEAMGNSSAVGGVAGVQNNSDTTTYPGVTVSGGVITAKDSRTYDYLVNKVQEQIQSDAAALDDLTVAVVVNTNTMPDAQKQELTTLVANAAAVDPSKVVIMAAAPASSAVSQAAQQASLTDFAKALTGNKVVLIAGGSLLLLLLFLIILVTAKRRNARREQLLANLQQTVPPEQLPEVGESEGAPEEAGEKEEAAAKESGARRKQAQPAAAEKEEKKEKKEEEAPTESIEELRNAASDEEERVKSQLQDFSDKNPEIAAQLIRSWLKGDDRKHG